MKGDPPIYQLDSDQGMRQILHRQRRGRDVDDV